MALSNWDTLAFDTDGQPSNGVVEDFAGGTVEIYKNWLYFRRSSESPGEEIQSGELHLGGFEIYAVRGPQEGIFCLVLSRNKDEVRVMAGIGCYGFDDPSERLAAAGNFDIKPFQNGEWDCLQGSDSTPKGKLLTLTFIKFKGKEVDETKEFKVPYAEDLNSQWVGVTPATYQQFLSWLEKLIEKECLPLGEWLEKVKQATPLRFNQGDFYLAARMGEEIPCSEPGESQAPILIQACKAQVPDNGDQGNS